MAVNRTMASMVTDCVESAKRLRIGSAAELSDVVRHCNAIGQKIRSGWQRHGSGSGVLELDLSGLEQVVEVNKDDMDCRVESGVTKERLGQVVAEQGLFGPEVPVVDFVGEMVDTNIPNTGSSKYKAPRTNVLDLSVVNAAGEVFRTGTRARKSSAGYDLTRLFLGSMGSLGIVTEVCMRLYSAPTQQSAAVFSFENPEEAVDTSLGTVASGICPAKTFLTRTPQDDDPKPWKLLMEFHGSHCDEDYRRVQELIEEPGNPGPSSLTQLEAKSHMPLMIAGTLPVSEIGGALNDMKLLNLTNLTSHVLEGFVSACAKDEETVHHVEKIISEAGGVALNSSLSLEETFGETSAMLMRSMKKELDPNGIFRSLD